MTMMWITKWAFSDGIPLEEGKVDGEIFYSFERARWFGCKLGRDCFDTKAEAITRVEAMRTAKIASLRKQIAKLEALNVEEMVK